MRSFSVFSANLLQQILAGGRLSDIVTWDVSITVIAGPHRQWDQLSLGLMTLCIRTNAKTPSLTLNKIAIQF